MAKKTAQQLKRMTRSSLAQFARQQIRQLQQVQKNPRKSYAGKTFKQYTRQLNSEINRLGPYLQKAILAEIDARFERLANPIAKRLNVSLNSNKIKSPAITRLKKIRAKFARVTSIYTLLERLQGFKLPTSSSRSSSASSSSSKRKATTQRKASSSSRKASTQRKTASSKRKPTTSKRKTAASKRTTSSNTQLQRYQKQVKQLQAKVRKLQTANSKLKSLSNQVKRHGNNLDRHIDTMHNQLRSEFADHSNNFSQFKQGVQRMRQVLRSAKLSPAQKIQRLNNWLERTYSKFPNTNQIGRSQAANSPKVKQDCKNIIRFANALVRQQQKRAS